MSGLLPSGRTDVPDVTSVCNVGGKNLEAMMQRGTFREDLYYRLNIFQISLPELIQRKTDILLLADHFIEKMNLKYGKKILRLSTPAIDMLMSYHWPGNVR